MRQKIENGKRYIPSDHENSKKVERERGVRSAAAELKNSSGWKTQKLKASFNRRTL